MEEFYALFRSSWPALPAPWIRVQQRRWGTMLQAIAEGRSPTAAAVVPGDNLDTLLSNLAGVWFLAELPGIPAETSQHFIDRVISSLGPEAEILRSDFLIKTAAMTRNSQP